MENRHKTMLLCRILDALLITLIGGRRYRRFGEERWNMMGKFTLLRSRLRPSEHHKIHAQFYPTLKLLVKRWTQKAGRDFNICLKFSLLGPEPDLVLLELDST